MTSIDSKNKKGNEWVSCRSILWIMVFFGFFINSMIKVIMNIAIVAMVVPRKNSVSKVQCGQSTNFTEKTETLSLANFTSSFDESDTKKFGNNSLYEWNEHEQGLVLGSYFWLYWTSQLIGGILARRYGTKLVFGLANFVSSIFGFFIPLATHYDIKALISVRVLQGFVLGVSWPSMHSMIAKWIPPNERSKFVTSYTGSSFGTAITFSAAATFIHHFGWESIFCVTSTLGVVWCVFWCFLIYDSPSQHPRISPEEKELILQQITKSVTLRPSKVPWKDIFHSLPFWATLYTQFGVLWGLYTFIAQAPTYFHFIHGWNINATGILAGAPHLIKTIFAIWFSTLCDWLLQTQKMSRTNVRKMATFIGSAMQGLFILALAFSGCHPYLAVAFLWAGITATGAVYSGVLAVLVDMSPNYASVLLGISGIFVGIGGFISPAIVSALTNNNQTIEQWRIVFLIAVFFCATSCVTFICFGTAEEQPWNANSDIIVTNKAKENETELNVVKSLPKTPNCNETIMEK